MGACCGSNPWRWPPPITATKWWWTLTRKRSTKKSKSTLWVPLDFCWHRDYVSRLSTLRPTWSIFVRGTLAKRKASRRVLFFAFPVTCECGSRTLRRSLFSVVSVSKFGVILPSPPLSLSFFLLLPSVALSTFCCCTLVDENSVDIFGESWKKHGVFCEFHLCNTFVFSRNNAFRHHPLVLLSPVAKMIWLGRVELTNTVVASSSLLL